MTEELLGRLQATLGGAYTVERELGGGGMSRVFVAEDRSLGRRVVVKLLPPDMAGAVNVERFKREVGLAARLQHPHIVPLLNAGEMDGIPYFTMPFIEGESLRARLVRHGELPVAEAMRVLREVASALAYAHERGVVHRDVKPDNVLMSGGAAMVTDFGVAKALVQSGGDASASASLTSMGVALGTPAYMAPEQASADPSVDHRADVYALGCMAYELLTGQPPFTGRSAQAVLAAHVQEEPEPVTKRRVGMPPALAALVMRCLAKRPADRPQTAMDVVHALDAITTPSGGMPPTSAVTAVQREDWKAGTGSRRALVIVFAGILAVAAGALVFHKGAPGSGIAPSARAGDASKSLAVLPFANVGGDTATEYFADGMTDEVTSALSKLEGLRVASRTSSFAYKGKRDTDVRVAGRQLNVGAILEGTVRRAGGRVRLTAQLTSAADGLTLWSDSYERDVKDVFAVQDELARAIAGALRLRYGSATPPKARSTDAETHDLVLRGDYLANRYDEPGLRGAISLYEQAAQRDPAYVPAWTGIANAWSRLADDFVAPREAIPHIRKAVTRALAVDSLDAGAHAQLALLYWWYDWNVPGARQEFARALSLHGGVDAYRDAAAGYSQLLQLEGLTDSARKVATAAADAEPTNELALGQAANLTTRGYPGDGERYCRRLAELEPDPGCLLDLYSLRGQGDSVLALIARRERASPAPSGRGVAYRRLVFAAALAHAGARDRARHEVAEALREIGTRYVSESFPALAWLEIGDRDSAFAWLERGLRSRSGYIPLLPTITAWAPMRSDPRYKSLIERAGLAPYVK